MQISPAARRIRENSKRPSGGSPSSGAVSLAMGEPDFDTPTPIVRAMSQALHDGVTHYGDLNGDRDLREAIASRAMAPTATDLTSANVSITHGASAAIGAAVSALVGPGEKVVIPEPTYSLYFDVAQWVGATAVAVPNRPDGQLDVDAVIGASASARLIIICNPVNPTGVVLSATSLAELGRRLAGSDTFVLVDEAYADIVYSEAFTSARMLPELDDRLILINTFSKTYAMTGWRLGYSIASPPVAEEISRLHRTFNGAPNSAVQRAGLAALNECSADVARMLDEYARRRTFVLEWLSEIEGIDVLHPDGAFYAFVRHGIALPSADVRSELAEAGVLVRQGDEYGPSGEGWIRLSFAASHNNLELGLSRLQLRLAQLREQHGSRR